MTQIQDRSRSEAPRLAVVRSNSSTTSTTHSTREMLEAVRAQLMNIEKKLSEESARSERRARVGVDEILACLKQHRHMTAPQLLQALPGLAKSSLWLHVNELERQGKVWFRLTYAGGKRKVTEIWHGEEIAT